jgi:hypothetical protein
MIENEWMETIERFKAENNQLRARLGRMIFNAIVCCFASFLAGMGFMLAMDAMIRRG